MNMHQNNAFERLHALGYTRLCPIIPPGAPISERSSLYKRLQRGDDARGKMPGIRWPDGTWSGFDFVAHESTPADLPRWHAMGAGVGIKTGQGLALIDADTADPASAAIVRATIEREIGPLPLRIGRAPKAGYLIRVTGEFQYARVEFGARNDKGRLLDRVEILYEGRQFVAHGIHPATGKPYHWPDGVPALDDVPTVSAEQLYDLLAALQAALPSAAPVVREGGGAEVSQSSLRADPELVRRAVAATPNDERFAPRESYVAMGFAIKAALGPEHDADGLDIFQDWCARWTDGHNEPDVVAAEWSRMKPPFRRGASWLFEQAKAATGHDYAADQWLDGPSDSVFPETPPSPENQSKRLEIEQAEAIRATPYDFPDPSAIPRREVLYGHHYVRQFVSTTAAPTKVGKTSLIIAEALAMASGKPLLGVQPAGPLRVWLWNGEDPLDELRRRIAATMMHYGLTRSDLLDDRGVSRLFVDSGRDMEIVLASTGRDGTKIAAPVEAALMRVIGLNRLDVLSIDPFVSSHRVPENDNGAVDLVAKRWAKIADRTRTAIELVHHVRKLNGAEVSIEDTRGASALISASRSARALARMTKPEGVRLGLDAGSARRLFRFADAQSNLALPAAEEDAWLKLESVGLGNGGGDGAEVALRGDSVGVVAVWEGGQPNGVSGGSDMEAVALERIRAGEWRKDIRSGDAWIGVPIAQAYNLDIDDPDDKGRVRALLKDMLKRGVLVAISRRDSARHTREYVECACMTDAGNTDSEVFG